MKNTKKIFLKIIVASVFLVMFLQEKYVFATNFGVNVEFDGKKIEMESETPEMEWNIEKLFPGETAETMLVVNSTGTKEVKVDIKLEILENKPLEESITLKIINSKSNEMLYDGKYKDFQVVNTKIPAKQTNTLKIIIGMPTEIGNVIQSNNCKVKFNIIARGEKNNNESNKNINNKSVENNAEENLATSNLESNTNINETEEKTVEEVKTDVINPIKKQQPIIIYIVLAVMIIVFIVLIAAFLKTK